MGFAAFTITRLGIVGSGGSSAALAGTASATRDSATAGSGATSTGTTTGATTTGAAATAGAGSATGAGTGVGSGISTSSGARAGAGCSRTPALSAAETIAVPVIASGATGFAAFTITRLGIVGSGGSSAALVGTASATRDSATAGSGVTSTGTTTGATTGTAATTGAGSATTTGTGSGSNGGGAVSIARMVSTGIASADSGTGNAAICTGSDGANVISNIGSADGRALGELVRTATCESTRRRISACGSGSIVSRMMPGCVRTGVIGGGAVGGADEHAANATHVVSAVNGSSVSEYFIECDHRW